MQRRVLNGRGGRTAAVALVLLGLLAVVGGVQRASARPAVSTTLPAAQAGPAAVLGGDPIVVGSTLSLTGSFGATGVIHKAAGEAFVRWINANGGLLGRPVEVEALRRRVRPRQGHRALRAADRPGPSST